MTDQPAAATSPPPDVLRDRMMRMNGFEQAALAMLQGMGLIPAEAEFILAQILTRVILANPPGQRDLDTSLVKFARNVRENYTQTMVHAAREGNLGAMAGAGSMPIPQASNAG